MNRYSGEIKLLNQAERRLVLVRLEEMVQYVLVLLNSFEVALHHGRLFHPLQTCVLLAFIA